MFPSRRDAWAAAGIVLTLLVVYNANGREIGSYDTRPTALAARELLLRGTLALNHVVGATPEFANRWGLVLARDGRYRSVYSPVAPVFAAAIAWPFARLGLLDLRAPLAPGLIAKGAASLLVALSVGVCYLAVRRRVSTGRALLIAAGLGLGTGLWSTASQSLWQSESALLGLSLWVLATAQPGEPTWRRTLTAALGIALAGAARSQLGPALVVLLVGLWWQWGRAHAAVAAVVVTVAIVPLLVLNRGWFGHPLGPLPALAEVNSQIHRTGATFGLHGDAWAGLLVSPSRGLLVFSPVVLVAAAGLRPAFRGRWRTPLPWCALALGAQFALYASYAVWWGGHTYGPRYLIDVLPLAAPLAAEGIAEWRLRSWRGAAAAAALAWSIAVAATGAFCYPNDGWNTDPTDIDRDHARLWDVADNQIRRCWQRGPSPQNFGLLDHFTAPRANE